MDKKKEENINWEFLRKFIPKMELEALKEHAKGEEKEHFVDLLRHVEKQIRNTPNIYECSELKAEDITVHMHYFFGSTDFWIYELDPETLEGYAFVCLNGWTDCAELGYVYIPEILSHPFIELDLYWDDKTTLKSVMVMTKV